MASPMYRQIAEDLRGQIEAGELDPGAKLPAENEFQLRYNASRNTVRDAIKLLVSRGLVETRPGQGTFVTRQVVPFVVRLEAPPTRGPGGDTVHYATEAPRSLRAEVSPIQVEILRGSGPVCAELGLPEDAQLISRHQRRFIDSAPWSLQTSFYPMRLVEMGATRLFAAADIELGTDQYLSESLGLRQVGWMERLAVRLPNMGEADFFGLPPDGRVSIVEAWRTGYDQNGTPMRVTVTVYPADRNQFVFTVGEVPSSSQVAATPAGPAGDAGIDDRAPAVVTLER